MKRLTLLAAIVLAVSLLPMRAYAMVGYLEFKNTSESCAWVTVYRADSLTPWSIQSDGHFRPRYVKPGEKFVAVVSGTTRYTEVKVRTEIERNADCSGGRVADISDYRKGDSDNRMNVYAAHLSGRPGRYILTF